MFLKINDELVNVNDIKSTRWYVIVTTTHGTYVLNGFDSDDKAKMLIDRIAEELKKMVC